MEVLVIGGGASGLIAAVSSARGGASVRILEKNNCAGRKILATGNGRCNFTNSGCVSDDFMGSQPEFIEAVLSHFGVKETLLFFEELGIFSREESEGRLYPYSEQAVSVLDALISELARLKVEIIPDSPVTAVKKTDEGFIVVVSGGRQYRADRIVVATGGKAGGQYGCSGDGYAIAKELGHQLINPRPALVQLVSSEAFFSQLKGVRAKGKVTLFKDYPGDLSKHRHQSVAQETGEIQFTETGLSGICIFNLSRCIRSTAVIEIDLIPEVSLEILKEKLYGHLDHCRHKTLEDFLNGIVNKKLIPVLLKECGVAGVYKNCGMLDRAAIDKIARILKEWPISIIGSKGFQDAQTTAGGVDTTEIDRDTLESKLVKGLYFAGEVLDVDGRCGGYNLQWAWTSGFVAGRSAALRFPKASLKSQAAPC